MTKKKILFKVLEIVLTYILPIVFVAFRYDLFKEGNTGLKLTAIGLIVVLVLTFSLGRNILEMISKIENATTRKILNIVKNLLLIAVLVIILCVSKDTIDNLIFITISCGVSVSIGNCFREDYRQLCKLDEKEKRQNEMIEAFRKAQSESKGE